MAKKKGKRKLRPAGVWPFSVYNPSAEAEWTPLELFGGGEEGFYFAESDASARFQDAARTTAAGSGDPLGGLTDLSGNGHHAGQSTAAARPTLTAASDKWYGVYDGSDDFLDITVGSGIIKNVTGATFWAIVEDDLGTDADRYAMDLTQNSATSSRKSSLYRASSTGQVGARFLALPASGAANLLRFNAGDMTSPVALVCTVNTATPDALIYVDGTSLGSLIASTSLAYENLAEAAIRIGSRGNDTSLWNGKISHAGCIDRIITSDERTELETWLAARKWA